jgi:hypothetical protein
MNLTRVFDTMRGAEETPTMRYLQDGAEEGISPVARPRNTGDRC